MKRTIIALSIVSVLSVTSFAVIAMSESAHAPSASDLINEDYDYIWDQDTCGQLLEWQISDQQKNELPHFLDGKTAVAAAFAGEAISPGNYPGLEANLSTLQAVTLVEKGSGPAFQFKSGDHLCIFGIKYNGE